MGLGWQSFITQGAGHGMKTGWEQMLPDGRSSALQRLVCPDHWQHRRLPVPAAGSCWLPVHRPLHLVMSLVSSRWAGSILSAAAALWAVPRMRPRCAGITATLPASTTASAPRQGTGHFPAFRGASLSGFNYICGLDGFAWPLKSISQRVVLKWVRNICGSCGFPPGLQEK